MQNSQFKGFLDVLHKPFVDFSEVVMGGAGGAAAPPIIETVRVLRGVPAPPKFLALRVLHPQYFDHNYLAGLIK